MAQAGDMIPQTAPWMRINRLRPAIDERIAATLSSQNYILGHQVESFEEAFAAYLGVPCCVGVASGTDALLLGLRALKVGPGDEVITVAMTAPATALAILLCGAVPRFVDIDRATRCMDPAHVSAAISPRTAAIVPVHLHGYPMDMPAIMSIAEQHGLVVLEDCAQAHGAHIDGRRVGTFGHAAAFSFYPTKNLGAVGDGGAVTTSDASVAGSVRALRAYGWRDSSRISEQIGYNSRLDELQAAILNVLLPELESGNAERRQMAQRYRAELRGLQESRHVELPDDGDGAVYHQFAIGVDHRDAVREHLLRRGHVMTGIHYSPALHHHPVFRPYAPDSLPVSEDLARRLVSLPIQPEAAAEHVAEIATKIGEAIKACSRS